MSTVPTTMAGAAGVLQPFPVVGIPAAQGRNRELAIVQPQTLPDLREGRAAQILAQGLRAIGGLIDHGAPVDDVDEAARQRRSLGARQQPDRHDGGFSEPRRNIHGGRQPADGKPIVEQPALPRERVVAIQQLEEFIKVQGTHRRFPPALSELTQSYR